VSIPTFTWIKMYPNDGNITGQYPHHSLSCNVIDNAQMLIIGGTFPLSDTCDAESQWGTHNLDLGEVTKKGQPWQLFMPNLTKYSVPDEIISVVGGSAGGGATKTAPANGFDNVDLSVLMTRKASIAATRTPTRAIPSATGAPDRGGPLSTGAIVGIAVGGGVALLLAVALVSFWVRRHRRKNYRPSPGPTTQGFAGPDVTSPWSPHPSQSSHYTPSSPYPQSPFGRHPSGTQQQPAELSATGTSVWAPGGSPPYEQGVSPASGLNAPPGAYADQPKFDDQGRPWYPQVSHMQVPGGHPSPLDEQGYPMGGGGYGPVAPGSPPRLARSTPQELSSESRVDAGWAGGSTGGSGATSGTGGTGSSGRSSRPTRHQTYYHA